MYTGRDEKKRNYKICARGKYDFWFEGMFFFGWVGLGEPLFQKASKN
jgi:hypothetical protein